MTDIYMPEPDPHPDLPYHVAYRFGGGGSDVVEARCRHCNDRWKRTSEATFEEWYRNHVSCPAPID